MGTFNQNARRSTRLPLQIPVIVSTLTSARDFRRECRTVVVNAHGCGVIVPELLENGTRVMVKLLSNGSSKEGHVVLAIPLLRISHGYWEWILTVRATFGKSIIRQQIGVCK